MSGPTAPIGPHGAGDRAPLGHSSPPAPADSRHTYAGRPRLLVTTTLHRERVASHRTATTAIPTTTAIVSSAPITPPRPMVPIMYCSSAARLHPCATTDGVPLGDQHRTQASLVGPEEEKLEDHLSWGCCVPTSTRKQREKRERCARSTVAPRERPESGRTRRRPERHRWRPLGGIPRRAWSVGTTGR